MSTTALPYTVESFITGDGYRCQYRRYAPAGTPRAEVVCIHGIQSHAGWYEHSCTALSRAGFAVYFIDRRGSGMNEGARGDTVLVVVIPEAVAGPYEWIEGGKPIGSF